MPEEQLKEQLQTLFDYNRHTNRIILDRAAKLTEGQLNATARHIDRSLFELLFHCMRTEWLWRNIAQSGQMPSNPPEIENFTKLATLRSFWEEEANIAQDYLLGVTEAELAERVDLIDREGKRSTVSRWGMLMHLLMHSTQHRSEAAVILTGYGQTPGELDLIYFLVSAQPGD